MKPCAIISLCCVIVTTLIVYCTYNFINKTSSYKSSQVNIITTQSAATVEAETSKDMEELSNEETTVSGETTTNMEMMWGHFDRDNFSVRKIRCGLKCKPTRLLDTKNCKCVKVKHII